MRALFINASRRRISLMVYLPQPPLGGIVVTVGQTVPFGWELGVMLCSSVELSRWKR